MIFSGFSTLHKEQDYVLSGLRQRSIIYAPAFIKSECVTLRQLMVGKTPDPCFIFTPLSRSKTCLRSTDNSSTLYSRKDRGMDTGFPSHIHYILSWWQLAKPIEGGKGRGEEGGGGGGEPFFLGGLSRTESRHQAWGGGGGWNGGGRGWNRGGGILRRSKGLVEEKIRHINVNWDEWSWKRYVILYIHYVMWGFKGQ